MRELIIDAYGVNEHDAEHKHERTTQNDTSTADGVGEITTPFGIPLLVLLYQKWRPARRFFNTATASTCNYLAIAVSS